MIFCQVARAAVIFKVDEIVVFEDSASSPRYWCHPCNI